VDSNKQKILILEDDVTLGGALKETLGRQGHSVLLATRPDEAFGFLDSNKVDFIFCDCLLPQMTGLDFIKKVRENYPGMRFNLVLMSGIYTYKYFVQEAVQKTQAVAFLLKPFENEQIIRLVKKEAAPKKEESNARKVLYQMFANPSVTNRQKRKVIESVEEVSGFDLPFLYSLLSETKSSGYLNIYNDDGSVSGISFCNGFIVGVDVDDRTTFLGEMLIQSGFAAPQDVQIALKDKNTRRIGNYLVQNNQLSPHAFDLILMEQMNIRLVRTIVDQKIRINFASAEVEMMNPSLDGETLLLYLHDWIASKISLPWLKSLYMMWAGNSIAKSAAFSEEHPALQMSLVKALPGFVGRLNQQTTLNQLLEVQEYSEIAVYKAIHFLLTKGLIVFAQRAAFKNAQEQLAALKKIWIDLDGKNSYEVNAYIDSASSATGSEEILADFISLLGERPKDENSELFKLWNQIKTAADTASHQDSNKLAQDKQAVQRTEAEAKLRASSIIEEVRQALLLNQFTKALQQLNEVAKLNSQVAHFHLYSSWAKLGGHIDPQRKANVMKEVELEMVQIPPDERYDALFPFVLGLMSKAKGDFVAARKSFEKCIAMDSTFIPARREISLLANANAKKQDVFNMDLKQVVSGFFKKR
jgi:CheY-like chemotaxis protein